MGKLLQDCGLAHTSISQKHYLERHLISLSVHAIEGDTLLAAGVVGYGARAMCWFFVGA
jgi:hypothetical protein